MLVERHGHPLARAAEGDALFQFARLDGLGQRMRVVGVIDALGRVGPEVEHLVTHGVEVTHQKLFHFVARVVAGDADFFHSVCDLSFVLQGSCGAGTESPEKARRQR